MQTGPDLSSTDEGLCWADPDGSAQRSRPVKVDQANAGTPAVPSSPQSSLAAFGGASGSQIDRRPASLRRTR
jgi:hypothetical protein